MTRELFDGWASRSDIVKIDTEVFVNLCSPDRSIVANIIWSHRGLPHKSSEDVRRFNISITEKGNSDMYEEMLSSAFNLNVYKYLMVNCHEPNYAIVYSLNLDVSARNFSLTMNELPLLGTGIISNEESKGISINF